MTRPSSDAIIAVLADIGRVPVTRVTPEARFADIGLGTSLTIGALRARLQRQFGLEIGPVDWKTTVRDILARAASAPPPASRPVASSASSVALPATGAPTARPRPAVPALSVGLDLQELVSLPDDRADAFYAAHFTPAELAGAETRADWRAHLCGLWCAKEAAKKAMPALMGAAFSAIEVRHAGSGAPHLFINGAASPAALSITHTATTAAAVVVVAH